MPETRLRAVIFDFGGVFTTSPLENFAAFEKAHRLPERFIGGVIKTNIHTNAWAKFERGEVDLAAFDQAFAAETRAAGFEIGGRTLVSLLALTLRPEMARALRRVKAAGFRTGCITNNLPDLDSAAMLADKSRAAEVAAVHADFDCILESSKIGVRKPEPRIYVMMCEALGVAPHECAFLDDLGVNLKPAKEMGMQTIKVAVGDAGPAIRELAQLTGLDL